MNLKERDRLAVFSRVRDAGMTLIEASRRLGLSYRQARRLFKRYRELGDAGLVHRLGGRPGNNRATSASRRVRALDLYAERYRGFGPTLAAEQMRERDGLAVNHETLRGWLVAAGLWRAARHKRRAHRRRERRACRGELVQLDGSDHAWFGDDPARCTLMVMVDDATGWTEARFFEAETTAASMTLFGHWVERHGLPRALYPDRHSIYRRSDKSADEIAHRTGKRPPTRFGEAMDELAVELICAHSPQAKGRVERMNATLQDRLVKLMKLEGITTIHAANVYLEHKFLPAHNARFAVDPACVDDAHRPAPEAEALDAALCPARDRRVVDKTGCVSWRGRCFELIGPDAAPRRRRRVLVREHLDGRVRLLDVTDRRVLASRQRASRPPAAAPVKPPLSDRVAAHAPPHKPSADHPWRQAPRVSVDVPARSARLHADADPRSHKGTLLLG
jgi:molybdenum-dependent DNA-binding transcriptional regulator ModE